LREGAFSGKMNKICILSPGRLARKYAHQLLLVEEFQKLNIEIIFINKAISQTPEDQMLLQIQGVISEYEREKITKKARDGSLYPKLAKSSCRQRPKEERITIPVPKIIDSPLFERAEERVDKSNEEISVNHILPLEENSFRLCSRTYPSYTHH
jgi:DNA invertase Pin-like site-specific DNA recombinase